MGLKLCLVFLLLAMAVVPHSSSYLDEKNWHRVNGGGDNLLGSIEDFFGDEDHHRLFSPQASLRPGRHLYGEDKYLSYEALRKNAIPCGRRGHSYYNCRKRQRANPYRRGCNVITRCARWTD